MIESNHCITFDAFDGKSVELFFVERYELLKAAQ